MSAHTPGPWNARASDCDDEFFAVIEADHPDDEEQWISIADLPGVEPYAGGEGQANARLIAAAPDMLEALRDIAALRGSEHSDALRLSTATRYAEAAIAKAVQP